MCYCEGGIWKFGVAGISYLYLVYQLYWWRIGTCGATVKITEITRVWTRIEFSRTFKKTFPFSAKSMGRAGSKWKTRQRKPVGLIRAWVSAGDQESTKLIINLADSHHNAASEFTRFNGSVNFGCKPNQTRALHCRHTRLHWIQLLLTAVVKILWNF